MKVLYFSLLAGLALAFTAQAQVPVGPGSIKLGKIAPAIVLTPEFNLTNGVQKRYKAGSWLEIEIEFDTKAEEIDELTFKYTIMVEKRLLDGEVTHINIPKGKSHYSVMYVSPRSLEKLTGGKPLTATSIENAWVVVSRQGQVLDQTALKPGAMPNLAHIAGLVMNKNETPFSPLYYDRYEAIKMTK